MIKSKGEKVYQVVINIILILVTLSMILPIVLLFMCSITDENTLVANGYSFFPAKIGFAAYAYILQNYATVMRAYGITILVTIIGTSANILITSMLAFPLSIDRLPGRKFFSFFVFFTMLFNGGLVPSYIMWTTQLGVKNTIWAYILPNFLMSAFNVILMRTYFRTSIPATLYEAAQVDGATYFRIYLRLVLPLGKPILVTVGLFSGLGYWNDWTNGLYYITKSSMLSIQALLNKMIQDIQALTSLSTADSGALLSLPAVSIRMAIAFVAILPILIIYPFLEKYFASGIMLGAVKG